MQIIMKKNAFLLVVVLTCLSFTVHAADRNHQGPVADAGIGIGVYENNGSSAMFTQRIGAQWKVADITKKLTVTAGLFLNNSYASKSETIELTWHGKEEDELDCKFKRDDISLLPTASLCYAFTPSLEAYFSLGLGVGILNARVSVDYDDGEDENDYTDSPEASSATNASFAMSSYIGMRYFFDKNWAVNAQFGMISGNFKSHASSFNLFSVGVSYRF